MKLIKIENSYDLGDSFSGTSKENTWEKIVNYIKSNKNIFNKLAFYKNENIISFQILSDKNLVKIINQINPSEFFEKKLIRTIKLNLKFNKETKSLEIDNSLNEKINDINTVSYNISYDANLKNDLYFDENSLLINYENIKEDEIFDIENVLTILFFTKTKIIKGQNNSIISEEITDEYLLLLYNKNENRLKYVECETLNKENEMFNLPLFIEKYNNNEHIDYNIFNINDENVLYKFSNLKLVKTFILIKDPIEDEILLFKNSLNKYIFDNFIESQYNRENAEDIN